MASSYICKHTIRANIAASCFDKYTLFMQYTWSHKTKIVVNINAYAQESHAHEAGFDW